MKDLTSGAMACTSALCLAGNGVISGLCCVTGVAFLLIT
jgi:hypothetical protein